jgi:hypothetical protein
LMKADWRAGIAACQLHGFGKPNLSFPSVRDFEGLFLRAQRDGTVVRRQMFWEKPNPILPVAANPAAGLAFDAAAAPVTLGEPNYPWGLFVDETTP